MPEGDTIFATINGVSASDHFLARFLEDSGFIPTAAGFQMRRIAAPVSGVPEPAEDEPDDDVPEGDTIFATINGVSASDHFLARFLEDSGFIPTAAGFQMRRIAAYPECPNQPKTSRTTTMPEGDTIFATINGVSASDHFLARFLEDSGFIPTAAGFQMRRIAAPVSGVPEPAEDEPDDNDA